MSSAVHGGTVWVAAGPDGLFTLEGNELVTYSTKITPERFDARGELLISARTFLLQPLPDRKFATAGLDGFITLTKDEPTLIGSLAGRARSLEENSLVVPVPAARITCSTTP